MGLNESVVIICLGIQTMIGLCSRTFISNEKIEIIVGYWRWNMFGRQEQNDFSDQQDRVIGIIKRCFA